MILLERDQLIFHFPEVHTDAWCTVELQRTLRIPDDDRVHSLPPGLGRFPLRHLDDFRDRLSVEMARRGGVVMPMHQAEALWISFPGRFRGAYPCAVKVATGKACAISGQPWEDRLVEEPQNYMVVPGQPWLDGYCVQTGIIRQFVAMPLGRGYTAEEQLTGEALHGGLQISVHPMKREVYEALGMPEPFIEVIREPSAQYSQMGLAPGGRMTQEIYGDEFGLDAWDQDKGSRCFITMANSVQWTAITGERPPTEPPTAEKYTRAGLPWFDYYDGDREALSGSEHLAGLKSVKGVGKELGESPVPDDEAIDEPLVVGLKSSGRGVREEPR